MKEAAALSLRSLALVLGAILLLAGVLDAIVVGSAALTIENPVARAALITFGVGFIVLAIFFPRLLLDPIASASHAQSASQPAGADPLRSNLYRWGEISELNFARLVSRSNRLSISGRTAVNILSRNEGEVASFLQRGGQLRLIVLNPARADALDIYTEPTGDLKGNLAVGLRYAEHMSRQFPGRVEIRTTSRPPTLAFVWTEARGTGELVSGANAVIQLKLYLDHSATGAGRPNLAVTSRDEWYETLAADFEKQWSQAKPLKSTKGRP